MIIKNVPRKIFRLAIKNLLDLDLYILNSKYPSVSTMKLIKMLRSVIGPIRAYILHEAILIDRARAKKQLYRRPSLLKIHTKYVKQTRSTGVEISDYMRLYKAVRIFKPSLVLECGLGLSTTAIAMALKKNKNDSGKRGLLISMEENSKWYHEAKGLIPPQLTDYINIVLSPKVEREYHGLKGVCYEKRPSHIYDFVFVDGPTEASPITGEPLFDMDFVFEAEKNHNIYGFVDHRLNTIRHLKKAVNGTHHVSYNPISKLGYLWPKGKPHVFDKQK